MIIDRSAYEAMIVHMQEAAPREGVGLLAGPVDTPARRLRWEMLADRWVPLRNTSDFPRLRYQVDGGELVDAWQTLEDDGRRPWVVCHSHTWGSAAPSPTDIRYAIDPTLLHLIVCLAAPEPVVRLWRLDPQARQATPEARVRFRVVDLGFQENSPTDLTRDVTGA